MPKLSLDIEYEIDFKIFGIVTPSQDFKFAHYLNDKLKLSLKRIKDREIFDNKSDIFQFFKQFHFIDKLDKIDYYLIKNKNLSSYCLPEFNIMDYLLLITGEKYSNQDKDLKQKLAEIKTVSSVLQIQPKQVKNVENILIDECNF